MEPYWKQVEQIIQESDILLEVLDARLIELSRNEKIEELVKKSGRPLIFVLNKIDLTSPKKIETEINLLKEKGEVIFTSNKDKKCIKLLLSKIRQVFSKYGKHRSREQILPKPHREAKADIVVGILGYPNVGKSSLINSLSFKKKVKVSKTSGTTHGIHWIKASEDIKLIDTPGVIPLAEHDEVRLGLIAAKSPERLKSPDIVAEKIIEMFLKENKSSLEQFYNITLGDETNSCIILEQLAKHKHFLKKGGFPDDMRMSLILIDDWQTGKLML